MRRRRSLSGSWLTILGRGSAGIVFRRIHSTWSTGRRRQVFLCGWSLPRSAEQWNAQAYGGEAAEDSPEAEEESAEGEGCALGSLVQGGCQGYAEESERGPVEDLPTIRCQGNCFRSVCGDDQSWQCSLCVCGINAGLGEGCGRNCDRDEPRRVSTGRSLRGES